MDPIVTLMVIVGALVWWLMNRVTKLERRLNTLEEERHEHDHFHNSLRRFTARERTV